MVGTPRVAARLTRSAAALRSVSDSSASFLLQSHNASSLSAASTCLTGGRFRNRESESPPQVPPWASRKAGMSPGEADAGQSLRTGSSLTPPPCTWPAIRDAERRVRCLPLLVKEQLQIPSLREDMSYSRQVWCQDGFERESSHKFHNGRSVDGRRAHHSFHRGFAAVARGCAWLVILRRAWWIICRGTYCRDACHGRGDCESNLGVPRVGGDVSGPCEDQSADVACAPRG